MSAFLQTNEWSQFQEALGRRTFFVSGENWRALLIRHEFPLGKNYLYCPRGPVSDYETRSMKHETWRMEEFLLTVREIAKQQQSIFFKWDVSFLKSDDMVSSEMFQVSSFKFRVARSLQPQHTIIVDLTKSEEQLLKDMHEKTRYNIRLAERKSVMVREAPGAACVDTFWHLLQETRMRDNFSVHPRKHYEKLIALTNNQPLTTDNGSGSSVVGCTLSVPFTRLYVAEYNHVPLAVAIIMFYNDTATYLHGASSNRQREVMAPHLLHWRIMQDAKRMGCALYDFWGIDDQNPAWVGITRFKRGFGGQEISYAYSIDIIFNRLWYGIYDLVKKFF